MYVKLKFKDIDIQGFFLPFFKLLGEACDIYR